jgi:SagB-type dehydrogenase family enzyme
MAPTRRSAAGATIAPILLPKPNVSRSKTVADALKRRKTTREIGERKLSLQTLSNLLWAACGVNRKIGPFGVPGRTAASASNSQEIDLYIALEEGIYFFNPYKHHLKPVAKGDFRRFAIGAPQALMLRKAPVQLVYVVDLHKLTNTLGYQEPGLQDPDVQKSYYFVDTGMIAGNVYLYAASQGLACWFHNCNRKELKRMLRLGPDQRVLFGQTVGHLAKQ